MKAPMYIGALCGVFLYNRKLRSYYIKTFREDAHLPNVQDVVSDCA